MIRHSMRVLLRYPLAANKILQMCPSVSCFRLLYLYCHIWTNRMGGTISGCPFAPRTCLKGMFVVRQLFLLSEHQYVNKEKNMEKVFVALFFTSVT